MLTCTRPAPHLPHTLSSVGIGLTGFSRRCDGLPEGVTLTKSEAPAEAYPLTRAPENVEPPRPRDGRALCGARRRHAKHLVEYRRGYSVLCSGRVHNASLMARLLRRG